MVIFILSIIIGGFAVFCYGMWWEHNTHDGRMEKLHEHDVESLDNRLKQTGILNENEELIQYYDMPITIKTKEE